MCVIGIVFGLCRGSFEGSPGVEAAREAVRLIALPHQPKLPRLFGFLGAHVLDVNLRGRRRSYKDVDNTKHAHRKCTPPTHLAGFETEFDLHLASLGTNPHVHLKEKWYQVWWQNLTKSINTPILNRLYLFAVIQQHDVIISQVILAEVWALLWHREITFLVWTPEAEK